MQLPCPGSRLLPGWLLRTACTVSVHGMIPDRVPTARRGGQKPVGNRQNTCRSVRLPVTFGHPCRRPDHNMLWIWELWITSRIGRFGGWRGAVWRGLTGGAREVPQGGEGLWQVEWVAGVRGTSGSTGRDAGGGSRHSGPRILGRRRARGTRLAGQAKISLENAGARGIMPSMHHSQQALAGRTLVHRRRD